MQNRPAWQSWLARRQRGLWRRRVDPRPVTTTSCGEMNAQNSSRVSATSCGTIQATASRLAGVARLAHFLTLEKRALPFRQGRNLRSAPLGEARSPVRDDSGYRKVANSDCAPYPFSQPAVWKKQCSRRLTPGMTGGCTPSISALNAGNFGPSPPGGERRVRWCAVTRPGQPRVRRLIARSARSERWY